MDSNMTIIEEIQAIHAGKPSCNTHNWTFFATCCRRRIETMKALMKAASKKATIAKRLTGMWKKIELKSKFIVRAVSQPGGAK